MGPWAFGVPLILVSTLGLLLNGYILLVVLGLGKQVNKIKVYHVVIITNTDYSEQNFIFFIVFDLVFFF